MKGRDDAENELRFMHFYIVNTLIPPKEIPLFGGHDFLKSGEASYFVYVSVIDHEVSSDLFE